MNKELLVAFFYILIRDHLTLGELFEIKHHVNMVKEHAPASYENAYMEQISRDIVDILTNA